MPGVRSATLGVWIRQGSAHETPDLHGASHMLEHLVFKGTRRRSARDIAVALERRGGSLDAYTSREHTSYQARVLDEHIPEALDVLADLTLEPRLREDDLALEKEVVLEEISTVEDTPDDLVFELHGERLWDGHGYGHPILGSRETVGAFTAARLRALHERTYRSDSLVVAGAGHVDHDDLAARARDLFGALPTGHANADPPEPSPSRGRVTVERDSAQTHIVFGGATVPHSDPRRYALVVLSAAFGGGMSSRLFQRIREELGLGYAVFSFQSFYASSGIAGVYLGTRPGWGERAEEALLEAYRRLHQEGLEAGELERAKSQVKGQITLSMESSAARLHRLATAALHGEPHRDLDEIVALVDAVGPGDVLDVARTFYDPERQLRLLLGPARKGR